MAKSAFSLKTFWPPWNGAAVLGVLLAFLVFLNVLPEKTGPTKQELYAFNQNCVEGVLHGAGIPNSCSSAAFMRHYYNVDPLDVLDREQGRLIDTAQKIARGDITNQKTYRHCIEQGLCAEIPVLPSASEKNTPQGKAISAEFWHLVNDGSPTAETCSLTAICRALVKIGIIPPPPVLAMKP